MPSAPFCRADVNVSSSPARGVEEKVSARLFLRRSVSRLPAARLGDTCCLAPEDRPRAICISLGHCSSVWAPALSLQWFHFRCLVERRFNQNAIVPVSPFFFVLSRASALSEQSGSEPCVSSGAFAIQLLSRLAAIKWRTA